MLTINVRFIRFSELHVSNLFGAVGVYVLWDSRSQSRPTYIGEGNILKRFGDHSRGNPRKLARPVDGYISIQGDDTRKMGKYDSQAIERLLLDVAAGTERWPSLNQSPGIEVAVRSLLEIQPTLRIKVMGFDPFVHPKAPRRLLSAKEIRAHLLPDGDYEYEDDWQKRRRRPPVI